jgi:2'-5' RNA ligase
MALSLVGDSRELRNLKRAVEVECVSTGLDVEKRAYSPHLTLARVKSRKAGDRIRRVAEGNQKFAVFEWPVDSFGLYQSELKQSGPAYTLIQQFKLPGQDSTISQSDAVDPRETRDNISK